MGRHRKPDRHRTRNALTVTAPIVGLPLAGGTAHALDWADVRDALIHCESGGNPTIKNRSSSAAGLFQITIGTWGLYGGREFARTASQATPAEQETIARRIFAARGLKDWVSSQRCWRHRIGKTTPKRTTPAPSTPAPPGRSYTIAPGDSLSEIAERTGHTWQDLWEANKQAITDPNSISVGLTINLL